MDEPLGESGSVVTSEAPIRPTAVEPREGYRIWLSYSDGAGGEVDLSHLADSGVFAAWNDRARFEAVHITDYDAIAWDKRIGTVSGRPLHAADGKVPSGRYATGAGGFGRCLKSAGSTALSSRCISTTTPRRISTRDTAATAP